MHMLQGTCNLVNVVPNLLFWKLNLFFLRSFEDEFQVSLLSPLDRNEEFVQLVVDEPVQVLNDVGIV
jgi:hypothetical protein